MTLFFAISAFLMTTLLARAKERIALHVPRFWARRALRILPLYQAANLLGVLLAHALNSPVGFGRVYRFVGRRGGAVAAMAVVLIAIALSPQAGFFSDLLGVRCRRSARRGLPRA